MTTEDSAFDTTQSATQSAAASDRRKADVTSSSKYVQSFDDVPWHATSSSCRDAIGAAAVHGGAGHADNVAPDEWVAFEFAKVRRFHATKMKMADRVEIEFFDGPTPSTGRERFSALPPEVASGASEPPPRRKVSI